MISSEQMFEANPDKPMAGKARQPYKHLLIDGGGLAVTAWTVQRELDRPEDRIRNAIYVAVTVIASLSGLVIPGGNITVAWDGADNRRSRRGLHPWYKHGRGTVVDRREIKVVVEQLEDLLITMGIGTTVIPGREADDLVASLATKIGAEDDVLVFSDDKDYLQLIDDRIHVSRRSMDGIIITKDHAAMVGMEVGERYLHIKALMGDGGDNIAGLRQIGEKKAQALLACNPNIVHECREDPWNVDWSNVEGALRKSFVRAGRRLLAPSEIQDPRFVADFCKKRGLKVPDDVEIDESECLIATAREIQWSLDMVTMDRSVDPPIKRSKPNLERIPLVINRLELTNETDMYSSLYRLAGMTSPGSPPQWRMASRAGAAIESGPVLEDKF